MKRPGAAELCRARRARAWRVGAQGLRGAGQHSSTQRIAPREPEAEVELTAGIIGLARRSGDPRTTALLRDTGWAVTRSRAPRISRRAELKVPQRQPKRGGLWLGGGVWIRLRPERADHAWAFDFEQNRAWDGRKVGMLCVVDGLTREALAILGSQRLSSSAVTDVLAARFLARRAPAHIRSDQRPKRVAAAVKVQVAGVGARTATSRGRAL